jgi:hypothetical protein
MTTTTRMMMFLSCRFRQLRPFSLLQQFNLLLSYCRRRLGAQCDSQTLVSNLLIFGRRLTD